MNEWSKLLLDGKEEEAFALMDEGDKLEEKFTKEEWEELIASCPNTQAKIAWKEKMDRLFPDKEK